MAVALAAARPVTGVSTQLRRAATKRSRAPRTSEADDMETAAEQLWAGKARGLFEFETIAPANGLPYLPMGAIGVVVGAQRAVPRSGRTSSSPKSSRVSRPRASSERAGARRTLGTSLGSRASCHRARRRSAARSPTGSARGSRGQPHRGARARPAAGAAGGGSALHGELPDDTTIDTTDAAIAAHGAAQHTPNAN